MILHQAESTKDKFLGPITYYPKFVRLVSEPTLENFIPLSGSLIQNFIPTLDDFIAQLIKIMKYIS